VSFRREILTLDMLEWVASSHFLGWSSTKKLGIILWWWLISQICSYCITFLVFDAFIHHHLLPHSHVTPIFHHPLIVPTLKHNNANPSMNGWIVRMDSATINIIAQNPSSRRIMHLNYAQSQHQLWIHTQQNSLHITITIDCLHLFSMLPPTPHSRQSLPPFPKNERGFTCLHTRKESIDIFNSIGSTKVWNVLHVILDAVLWIGILVLGEWNELSMMRFDIEMDTSCHIIILIGVEK